MCLVSSWIMPAIASAPPDGISTVVSARRVRIEGTVAELVVPGIAIVSELLRRQVGDLGHHLEADAALAEHDRREIQTDTEFLEVDRRLAGRRRPPVAVVEQEKPLRTGNSPPAMNVAVSPEIAVRLGSASV